MKRILTLLITAMIAQTSFACTASFTASVSGDTVKFTNTSSGTAAPMNCVWQFGDGKASTLIDPTHVYSATGRYAVTLIIYYLDSVTHSITCEDTAYDSVTITTTGTNEIRGDIFRDTSHGAVTYDSIKVWLITYDSATSMISAIDSQSVYGGYHSSYDFSGMPTGSYLVKAQDLGATSGSGFVPTYHNSTVHWDSADAIIMTGGTSVGNNIYMLYGTVTSGPGFIAGNVLYGAGKMTKGSGTVGAPVVGLIIYLTDNSGKLVSSAITDASGNYSFSHLPVGTYTVYPEAMGYVTTPSVIAITTTKTTVDNVSFKENSTSIKPSTTGIATVAANGNGFNIYPNPSTGSVSITCPGLSSQQVTISVINVSGQKLRQETVQMSNGNATLHMEQMPAGMYFINVNAAGFNQTQKLFIQH